MKTLPRIASLIICFCSITTLLHAQVPQLINYQGRVLFGSTNFDGSGQFKFALVNTAGTTAYWTNDGSHLDGTEPSNAVTLTVTKGLYSVLLGDTSLASMTALPSSVFTNSDVRLRVWFNDGTHGSQLLSPDQRLAAAGYAFMAGNVTDGAITSTKLGTGAVTSTKLASGAVTTSSIANGAVGSTQLGSGLTLAGTTTGTFSGPLNGNASTATSFTGSLVGNVTGTQGATVVSFVGGLSAANVASGATLANNNIRTPGTQNLVLGQPQVSLTLSGQQNAGVGARVMETMTTGDFNAGVGYAALFTNSGSKNTGMGYETLYFNTGNENTATGYQALLHNTSGAGNTATGSTALFNNSGGSFNTATGYQALINDTGSFNTATGGGALLSNTAGANNTAMGYNALASNLTGSNNNAIGFNALLQTTGSNNIAIGRDAGINITSGSNNIDIGNTGLTGAESNTIRIGTTGVHTGAVIAGDTIMLGKAAIGGGSAATHGTLEILANTGSYTASGATGFGHNQHSFLVDIADGTYGSAIYANGDVVVTNNFVANSDERIKNIIGRSDAARDLSTLLGIEITDYRYKDVVAHGEAPFKKVIAQQVEKVFPQAVTKRTGEVPDIYKLATIKDGWIALATDLKLGERVKLITDEAQGVYEVLEVQNGAFRTDFKPATDKVFVYGREVKDFRNVDYDAIAMLNVSATQQMQREIEALEANNILRQKQLADLKQEEESRLAALRNENATLRADLAALVAREKERDARLTRLEISQPPTQAVSNTIASSKESEQ